MPLETYKKLLSLVQDGAKLVMNKLPEDVSGFGDLENQRAGLKNLEAKTPRDGIEHAFISDNSFGKGVIYQGMVKNDDSAPVARVVRPEVMSRYGLSFVRRSFDGGWNYFIANRSDKSLLAYQSGNWLPLSVTAKSVVVMNPMTGKTGVAKIEHRDGGSTWVYLPLESGESVILRAFADKEIEGSTWNNFQPNGQPVDITGRWNVKFLEGGPTLPADFQTSQLASWTTFPDTNCQAFAGTAKYTTTFDADNSKLKTQNSKFYLDLGDVRQSARVRVNGKDYGTLIMPPFRVVVDNLKPTGNTLEVEVTSVAANRIRDLDRRGVKWKTFRDINMVDINYKPFDASNWPLTDCGLLGPVTLTPLPTK
jgi:hypothetical protein